MRFAKNMDGETNEKHRDRLHLGRDARFRHHVQPFITDTRICIFESNGARAARSDANCQMNNANYETNPTSILFSTDDANGGDGNPTMN